MSNEQIKHTYVSSTDIDTMPIANGRIFSLNDKSGMGYDVNNHRYRVLGSSDDTTNNKVTFTSYDNSTTPSSLTDMPAVMSSNQTHGTLFSKLSIAMHNLRYIIRLLGSTDISGIGNGTVTGGMSDMNSRIGFRGTQAEYEAAVQAGLITNGMTVAITDDYSNSAIDAANTIADVETGTASRAYAVGEYVIYNNQFYRVKQAIASGGTFTVGTNIEAKTVGEVLTDINNRLNYPS